MTPVATVAPTTGTPAASAAVTVGSMAPTATNVAITGTPTVGQVLTGSYTFADANGDPQGTSTFRWLRNGVAIAGATATTYTLVADDYLKSISFEVTPVASAAVAVNALPAGYVYQGGLIWMPVTLSLHDYGPEATSIYCQAFNGLGQTGWRQPTSAELSALYTSGSMNGQGWSLGRTWAHDGGLFFTVDLTNGNVVGVAPGTVPYYQACVR